MASLGATCIPYPDFASSMLRGKLEMEKEYDGMNRLLVEAFKKNYEENIATEEPREVSRIPKIIHQIWLGGKVPEKYREWMQTWSSLEGWDYCLWTDADVETLQLHNRDLYDMSGNYGEKSDILRLELLQKYGGIYVDVDYECIRADFVEELNKQYDFYIGFEPIEHGKIGRSNIFKMCNALIASIPGHPLVKHLVTNLKANYLAYRPFSGALQTSGPSYITRIICEYLLYQPDCYRNMYLPATFFYPLMENELVIEGRRDVPPESIGIHYWSGSWHPNKAYKEGGVQ
jgi:mannosyltransferase OCH1-like enzyme